MAGSSSRHHMKDSNVSAVIETMKNDITKWLEAMLSSKMKKLNALFMGPKGINSKVSSLQRKSSGLHKSVKKLQTDVFDNQTEIAEINSVLTDDVSTLALDNHAKLLYNNIKIGGLPFTEGEDPISVVEQFFTEVLQIQIEDGDILEVSRMKGNLHRKIKGHQVEMPPLMFVKCSPSLQKLVEDSKGLVQKAQNPKTKIQYTIKNHLPEAHYAARLKFNAYIKDIIASNKGKTDKERIKFYFRGEHLFVNGNKVIDSVHVPTMDEILNISPAMQSMLDLIVFEESHQKTENKSVFQAYGLRASTSELQGHTYLLRLLIG